MHHSFLAQDEKVERELRALVGDAYPALDELSRTILIMAHSFGDVRNLDVQPQRAEHPRVIGEHLSQLANAGWLLKQGHALPLAGPAPAGSAGNAWRNTASHANHRGSHRGSREAVGGVER